MVTVPKDCPQRSFRFTYLVSMFVDGLLLDFVHKCGFRLVLFYNFFGHNFNRPCHSFGDRIQDGVINGLGLDLCNILCNIFRLNVLERLGRRISNRIRCFVRFCRALFTGTISSFRVMVRAGSATKVSQLVSLIPPVAR